VAELLQAAHLRRQRAADVVPGHDECLEQLAAQYLLRQLA
jgi:hypothetical protein